MKQQGGVIPLTREQQELVIRRSGEKTARGTRCLSLLLEQLVERHGLEPIKQELAEIERKIEMAEDALLCGPISGDTRFIFDGVEQYIEGLRNG